MPAHGRAFLVLVLLSMVSAVQASDPSQHLRGRARTEAPASVPSGVATAQETIAAQYSELLELGSFVPQGYFCAGDFVLWCNGRNFSRVQRCTAPTKCTVYDDNRRKAGCEAPDRPAAVEALAAVGGNDTWVLEAREEGTVAMPDPDEAMAVEALAAVGGKDTWMLEASEEGSAAMPDLDEAMASEAPASSGSDATEKDRR